jgi:putative aldouronate transport system substrate-binding protein
MKRLSLLFVVFYILATLFFTACSTNKPTDVNPDTTPKSTQTPEESTPAPEESTEDTEPQPVYTLPLTTAGETLRIACPDYSIDTSISGDLPVFQEIEKRTGVKIIFEPDRVNYATTMQTRIAAGVDLPDMFVLPDGSDPIYYGNEGIIIPLNELIEKNTIHLKQLLIEAPHVKKSYTAPDGNMYTLPLQLNYDVDNLNKYNNIVLMTRKDWLKKLGLDVPKTIDDFYNMLKAFKEGDPNGNNEADEIPYSMPGVAGITYLGWMYNLHLTSAHDGFYTDSSGKKIVYEWMEPRAKEFLTTMNKWFEEGLIDQGFMSLQGDKWTAQITNNLVGITAFYSLMPQYGWDAMVQASSGDPEAGFVQIPTPSGPYGEGIIESNALPGFGHFAISKNCKNPELAIKWIDYIAYSEDGVLFNYYGIEGLTYEMVDGKPKFFDHVLNSPDTVGVEMMRVGATHHVQLPILVTNESTEESFGEYYKQVVYGEEMYQQMLRAPKIPPVLSTKEEAEVLANLIADINVYRDEMVAKFIVGDIPLDKFDEFVATLKEIGIEEVLRIKQAQFDRSNQAVQ